MLATLDSSMATPEIHSARLDAWQGLGDSLQDAHTAEQALKFGRLSGWNLRKEPTYTRVAGRELVVPDRFAIIRDNPFHDDMVDVLGDVGRTYKIVQNEQLAGMLDTLVEDSGATYATGGAFDGGSTAFVTLKLAGAAKVGGTDLVENYLAVMTNHDGNAGISFMVTPVRVRCRSTLNLAFKKASHTYSVRHTVGAEKIMHQQARDALSFAYDYLDAFQEEADRLVNTSLSQSRFETLISQAFGAPKGAPGPTVTRVQNKLDHMAELFSSNFAQEGIGGTAWAGLAALTEYYDHFSPVRPAGRGTEAEVRSRKALLDPDFKNQALKLMLTEAK